MSIAAELIPTSKVTIPPIADAERAHAMDAVHPLLDRFARTAERVPRPDLNDVSEVLLRAHAHAQTPVYAARWRSIPGALFDVGCVDALRVLGIACRTVSAALASSDDAATRARLRVDLVQEATATRTRVTRYLEYHLADNPVAARELDGIRAGQGYNDLESDLRRIAVLTATFAPVFAGDRHYQATDAATCIRLADTITTELSTVSGTPTGWVDRLWAAIRYCYGDEVRPTASWLFRATPSELQFYPSIYVGFGRPRPTPTSDAPATGPTVLPTDAAPATNPAGAPGEGIPDPRTPA